MAILHKRSAVNPFWRGVFFVICQIFRKVHPTNYIRISPQCYVILAKMKINYIRRITTVKLLLFIDFIQHYSLLSNRLAAHLPYLILNE